MSAPQAICPDIFLAGVTIRLKLTTRLLNMRILRRLPCTAGHLERTYKSGWSLRRKGCDIIKGDKAKVLLRFPNYLYNNFEYRLEKKNINDFTYICSI